MERKNRPITPAPAAGPAARRPPRLRHLGDHQPLLGLRHRRVALDPLRLELVEDVEHPRERMRACSSVSAVWMIRSAARSVSRCRLSLLAMTTALIPRRRLPARTASLSRPGPRGTSPAARPGGPPRSSAGRPPDGGSSRRSRRDPRTGALKAIPDRPGPTPEKSTSFVLFSGPAERPCEASSPRDAGVPHGSAGCRAGRPTLTLS